MLFSILSDCSADEVGFRDSALESFILVRIAFASFSGASMIFGELDDFCLAAGFFNIGGGEGCFA